MKRLFMPLAACATMALTACHLGQTKGGNGDADTLLYSTVVYEDSVCTKGNMAYQQFRIDYPLKDDNSVVADSIRAWLKHELSLCCYPEMYEVQKPVEDFKGDIRDGDALARHYGSIGTGIMGMLMQPDEEGDMPSGYGNDYQGTITAQTANYLTYTTGYNIYTGGAHGLYIEEETTFSRTDGKRMGWNLVDTINARQALMRCLREGILEYFDGNIKDDEPHTLRDYLFTADLTDLPDDSLLALPSTPPALKPEGVSFVYQQYEIAAYAFGLPSCIIPYEKAKAFLTPEGKCLAGL